MSLLKTNKLGLVTSPMPRVWKISFKISVKYTLIMKGEKFEA